MINASNIWQFSASSKEQLERCLAGAQFDSQNKWIKKFGIPPPTSDNDGKQVEVIVIDEEDDMEVDKILVETENVIESVMENEQHVDFFREVVDTDPVSHFNKIVDMCLQDKSVYSLLLNNLSPLSLQKLCNHIFSSKDIKREFLESFYKNFLPLYLKKENTWLSLDILVKAKECHGEQFRNLLLILLNEKDFSSNILQEFVSTLNLNEISFFFDCIIDCDVSNEMFLHNLQAIFLAYKECAKDENIQSYILMKFTQISDVCPTDKNYGRFLLYFIQNSKSVNLVALEKLVDAHKSAFKRPCLNALNNLR